MGKAALLAFAGTAVGAAFGAAFGAALGELALLLASGIAVAEDPQANNRATNKRTIALGQCLAIAMPDPGLVIIP